MPDGLRIARHFLWGTPSVKTYRFCQLPLGGSLWRTRKLCALAGNCAAMPKAPSQRTTSPGGEKMSRSDKKGNLSSVARLGEFRQVPPQALRASSPKGTPLRYAGNFTATTKSRPLGEGGLTRSGKTEGVTSPPRLRGKNSVENHSLCPFSTPGFSPRRFVENCPGQNSRLEKSKPVSRSKL